MPLRPIAHRTIPYTGVQFFLAFLLCSSSVVVDAQSPSTGTLRLYRPKQALGSALKTTVTVDDTATYRLANGEVLDLALPPGPHKIQTPKTFIDSRWRTDLQTMSIASLSSTSCSEEPLWSLKFQKRQPSPKRQDCVRVQQVSDRP